MRNPHRDDVVVIPKAKYDSLVKSRDMLQALEAGGVDNWKWYSESLQPFYKKYYPEDYDDADKE